MKEASPNFNPKADMFLTMYSTNYIKSPVKFCVLHTSINNIKQLNVKTVAVNYNSQTGNIEVFGTDPIPIGKEKNMLIQDLKWGSVKFEKKEKRYIYIVLKNTKQPLVLHGKDRDMDIWFDALLSLINPERAAPETDLCKQLTEDLSFGLNLAEEKEEIVPEVPPLPKDLNFK